MTNYFAKILGPMLDQLYHFLVNMFNPATAYALSITLFTIFVKLILIPLYVSSQKSMMGMQKIQPETTKLQEKMKKAKTKEEQEKVNKEMAELYRKHNVNPAKGCLPLLMQFPILLGLFRVFSSTDQFTSIPQKAIEGQFLWLPKLSVYHAANTQALAAAKDPYYILPILVGITMYLSTKITQKISPTPQNSDAQSNQMMSMMNSMNIMFPIMIAFTTAISPAALGIYFLVGNIFQIFQTYIVNKLVKKD